MPWTVDREGREVRIVFHERVDIRDARALHGTFVDLADDPRPIHVDLVACTGFDAATLQLLLALHGARSERNLPVTFALGAGGGFTVLDRVALAHHFAAER
jgi:STAS domain-containing protein